ncbi:conserved hypothetical protein [Caldicellulosiruptor hydrothermalis 108]|uniref:Uncharacterized protein n=1 Tax=Caldicellulosiruptor hydrothermalis (strain DSM 18901 / VKM B-2411 / 108) TaxID=632292 RepID=E4QAG1_CALH1|nr:hypothetical protein [Caldicellulosiruptor hydrothermalis]ADQ08265.1 conserved hypothetical protein [Caldicellulosiruptor hydrothermalis 108]
MSEDYMLEHTINKIAFELVNEKILDENEINKLLGVLCNDGVYAMWVYALDKLKGSNRNHKTGVEVPKIIKLSSKIEKVSNYIKNGSLEKVSELTEEINSLANEINNLQNDLEQLQGDERNKKAEEKRQKEKEKLKKEEEIKEKINQYFLDLANNLENLLFFKELFEKILIYARYHAKAMEDSK